MEEVSKTGSIQLSLFKAETEEELEKIKGMEAPVMSQAINAYYTITVLSEFREKERLCMNGSGKTTFAKLLCCLYVPINDQILLNGIDIRRYLW